MNAIELNLFASQISAICDEMGSVLQHSAFSPNIKDRLDFSCAVFDPEGELCAQAAHIPVHLGSMAFAMGAIVKLIDWCPGDVMILNDPFLGGTHLPDVTVVSPVLDESGKTLFGFVANRAHHANIGCDTPGSMPISKTLAEEGRIIPPTLIYRHGIAQEAALNLLGVEHPDRLDPDFVAQFSANKIGVKRFQELAAALGSKRLFAGLIELNHYAEKLALSVIAELSPGIYQFEDCMDDDGVGTNNIPLAVKIEITPERMVMDFNGSAAQVSGNLNCPLSVTAASVFYCFRCLMPDYTPACAGTFRPIRIKAEQGLIVNALRPAAVAAGNVETSMRLVDVIFGALAQAAPERIPAASQGTMNNVAMGYINDDGSRWDYYETLAGGMGGGPRYPGLNGVHSHMTNTLNTPVESLEMHFPLRILEYRLRNNTGGAGMHSGGSGITRQYEFLSKADVTLLTERRSQGPWGLEGGQPGVPGRNILNGKILPAKVEFLAQPGDRLTVCTPGGGGFGLDRGESECR